MAKPSKTVVSVSEMARLVGLSRSRFYQLLDAGIFPRPMYDGRRPVYTEELQKQCLEVKQRNLGVNGRAVLFNSARNKQKTVVKKEQYADLIAGLKSLGLKQVTVAQVKEALGALYPQGMTGVDEGEVIKAVFVKLWRKQMSPAD